MGCAEVISLPEERARKQWDALRHQLHDRFDQWLAGVEKHVQGPEPTLSAVTETVWHLRQERTGGLTQTRVEHAHLGAYTRKQVNCPKCDRLVQARSPVQRTVETLGGPVALARPYCYCRACRSGVYPLDEALDLVAGRTQLDVQKVVAKLVTAVPYDEAHTLLSALTGVGLGSERMHT